MNCKTMELFDPEPVCAVHDVGCRGPSPNHGPFLGAPLVIQQLSTVEKDRRY